MDYIDLHTHSAASDGTDAPAELVRKAASVGLRAIALTDHDTLAGLPEAEAQGRDSGLEVVRGCEISADSPYGEVHILGLWLPRNADGLENVLKDLRRQRMERNLAIVKKLTALGLRVDYEEVLAAAGGETVGRPHIAAVLLRKGYIASLREGFDTLLGRGGKAFAPRKVLGLVEAVRLLAGLGATACMAHPRLSRCPDSWLEQTAAALVPHGLTALETYHSEYSEADQRFCMDMAARHKLENSGGSDYHGGAKPGVRLGYGRGGLRVPGEILDDLKAARRARGLWA